MERLKELPHSSYALIDVLDKLYPSRCIKRDESLEQAHRYAGARELVENLLDLRNAEEKKQSNAANQVRLK